MFTLKTASKKIVTIILISTIINVSFIGKAFAAMSASSIISLSNSSRAEAGLGDLSNNGQLTSAATAKANDMLEKDYFSHTSPDGKTPWDFISASGYGYVYAGENLAIGYNNSTELHSAWMNSPSHRENIMNPNFREIGVAVVSGEYQGAETTVVVQVFGSTSGGQNLAQSQSETQTETQTETKAEVQSESTADSNAESNPASENTPEKTEVSKEFALVSADINPKKIFAGDEVSFKLEITGNAAEMYFSFNDQKIDMKEAMTSESNSDKKIFEKKEKITKEGKFPVSVTAIDKNGNREAKDIGSLEVAKKVLVKSENQSLSGNIKNSFNDHWLIYSLALLMLVSGVAYLVIAKNVKLSHKLTKSLAAWEF